MTQALDSGRSLPTRRGFVAAASLGILGLYGVWAALGASGKSGKDVSEGHAGHGEEPEIASSSGGHGGHGASAGGPSTDDFRRLTEDFSKRWKQQDGSVRPGYVPEPVHSEPDPHAGHDMHAQPVQPEAGHAGHDPHAGHDMQAMQALAPNIHAGHEAAPVDTAGSGNEVYLMAYQWGFEPSWLKLEAGKTYRFRMMAVDASHGASIQIGSGSLITRLRQGVLTERDITFTAKGSHLLYCTVFCGAFHDRMTARIDVV
ncbi:MAG: hypothetical protein HQL43_02800 [Alphaproteobacteria bacterium]|nr:hypothetical protein [Alphaproteobacteria bacterium]